MHVRVRIFGKPDTVVLVESKLTKIEQFRKIIQQKFDVKPESQRLFYGGKLLENGYTFHDYNIKLNDVIQLMLHIQPQNISNKNNITASSTTVIKENSNEEFKDAESTLYAVDDLIDMKDPELGAWFEGSITRIVYNPKLVPEVEDPDTDTENHEQSNSSDGNRSLDKESSAENNPPSDLKTEDDSAVAKNKGITRYFCKTPKAAVTKKQNKMEISKKLHSNESSDENLLFVVQLDEDENNYYCKLNDIRPRARTVIDIKNLEIGQKVMLNHNIDEPLETGYWYDFKVSEIIKYRVNYKLIGTIYLGADDVPQNIQTKVLDKVFAIEEAVPVKERTEEYKKMMLVQPEKRSLPLKCYTCRDDEEMPCRNCGCYLCSGKEFPDKIVLCDDCNKGFHMICLTPPLITLPEEDWYCPSCKRDPNEVVAPGAAKQTKKETKTSRDWGRGMACVGKTKSCSMPPNHFGPIPGIEVGMCWRFRIQLSETGVHRPPVSGIHGRDIEGAYSIVLSGGYEDDVDNGDEFTYTGSGGRDLSGNKRTAVQSCDQTLTRENKALARNCAVKQVSEKGGNAKGNWKDGKPVRVVRSYKMLKHFPKYAPKEGIRYDGIYKVVKYYPEVGLSGYRVWKYLLRRDDPSPAPWEPDAIEYPIIYPDGYLEAEAEKKALKEMASKKQKTKNTSKNIQKRPLRESNQSTETESDVSPPVKKRKMRKNKSPVEQTSLSPNTNLASIFTKSPRSNKSSSKSAKMKAESVLSAEEKDAIKADSLNCKLWDECLIVCESRGRKEFVEYVSQMFLCIICQDLAVNPVTTPCLHNFCMGCMKLAFKNTAAQNCPACRQSLTNYNVEVNDHLKVALRTILSGYDAGKK